jgi:hypothetical protein
VKVKCCANLRGRYRGNCERNGTVERGGKWYCRQHDPVLVAEQRAAKAVVLRAEAAALQAKVHMEVDRHILERDAGVDRLTDAELRAIIAAGGMRKILAGVTS